MNPHPNVAMVKSAPRAVARENLSLAIDASNLRGGGSLTHIVELLSAADPVKSGFTRVTVWGVRALLDKLPVRPWLNCELVPSFGSPAAAGFLWQHTRLDRVASGYDLLFVPGGRYNGRMRPFVTMSRNLLPFDKEARSLYRWSVTGLRLRVLSIAQTTSLRKASGLIFLSHTAQQMVQQTTGELEGETVIIPHGVTDLFMRPPRPQQPLARYSIERPFRWLYASIIDLYKNQWEVAKAVAALREEGYPVALDLVGPAYPPALARLKRAVAIYDPENEFITYRGPKAHNALAAEYHNADAFVFGSLCENLPNVLLEAMAAGLPIACSDRGVMPEVLGDAGVYFDPDDASTIVGALKRLMDDSAERQVVAARAYERVRQQTWQRCAHQTFDFLAQVARMHATTA